MAAPEGNPLEALPISAQIIIYGSAGIAIAVWAIHNYLAKKKEPEVHKDFVISQASIADMGPVRQSAAALERIADAVEDISQMMKDDDLQERKESERVELLGLLRKTVSDMLEDPAQEDAPPLHKRQIKRPHRLK